MNPMENLAKILEARSIVVEAIRQIDEDGMRVVFVGKNGEKIDHTDAVKMAMKFMLAGVEETLMDPKDRKGGMDIDTLMK